MDGRPNPLMEPTVVGAVLFGVGAMVAVVSSPHYQLLGCSECSEVVVVVVGLMLLKV